jgi:hypothetical protein
MTEPRRRLKLAQEGRKVGKDGSIGDWEEALLGGMLQLEVWEFLGAAEPEMTVPRSGQDIAGPK